MDTTKNTTPAAQGAAGGDNTSARGASDAAEGNSAQQGVGESGVGANSKKEVKPAKAATGNAPAKPGKSKPAKPVPAVNANTGSGSGPKNDITKAPTAAEIAKAKVISDLMVQQGVDTLYENTNEEYFTQFDLAVHSEGGKKDNVITHSKPTV